VGAGDVREHQVELWRVTEAHHFLGAQANHFFDDVRGIAGGFQSVVRADFLRRKS